MEPSSVTKQNTYRVHSFPLNCTTTLHAQSAFSMCIIQKKVMEIDWFHDDKHKTSLWQIRHRQLGASASFYVTRQPIRSGQRHVPDKLKMPIQKYSNLRCLDVWLPHIFHYFFWFMPKPHITKQRCVTCSFGILAKKWRTFHVSHSVSLSVTENTAKTCCLLHNLSYK